MAKQHDADTREDPPSPMRRTFGWLDDHGPDSLWGVSRYEDYPDDMDSSEALLDPLSEAKGRYVSVCSQLEITLFRLRSELDLDMTFAEAEWKRGPKQCISDLRGIAETFPAPDNELLDGLLVRAQRYLDLRNG